jgi:hypothetical protein
VSSIIIIDVETTGVIQYDKPLWHADQPRVTQIAAVQFDRQARVLNSVIATAQRIGWTSSAGARDLHQIPDRQNDLYGLSPVWWLGALVGMPKERGMLMTSRKIAGFPIQFMRQMLEIEMLARAVAAGHDPAAYKFPDVWKSPMKSWIDVKAEAAGAMGAGTRKITLADAHQALVGRPFTHRYDAFEDVQAVARIVFALVAAKKLEI